MKKTILCFVSALALTACAKSPESIAPVSMGGAFESLPCARAAQMLASERQTLAALDASQRGAVAGDAFGVFLLGVPVSSLTGGNKEGLIATSKGKIVALEARLATCQ